MAARTWKGGFLRLLLFTCLLVASVASSDPDYEDESPDEDEPSAEHGAGALEDGDLLPGSLGASTLPLFQEEPKDSYIVKNSPATLKCAASNALDLNFKCSMAISPRDLEKQSFNDPHTGVPHVEATVNISRNQVDEYFGGPFTCFCTALSSHGKIRSRQATVTLAYMKKPFTEAPYSARIALGGQMELRCLPPAGVPPPTVSWLKNGQPLLPADTTSGGIVGSGTGGSSGSAPAPSLPVAGSGMSGAGGGVFVSGDGHLLIGRAKLSDQANYTCVAENIAARRQTEPVQLTVYVDGDWSDWSVWTKCSPPCGPGTQRRYRVCNSPPPTNGGADCPGHSTQRTSCEADCPGRSLSSGPQAKFDGVQSTEDEAAVVHVAAEKELHAALYVGLGVAFSVFSLVAVFLVRLLRRRALGSRRAYTEASTGEYPADFIHNKDEKPDLTQTVAVTMPPCYHYPLPLPRSDSEHHYDEPHLATPSPSSTCSSASASTSPSATSTRTVGSSRGNGSVTGLSGGDSSLADSGVAMTTTSVTPAGARLALPECGVSLTVPEGALARGQEALLSLAVLTEDRHRPRLSDGQTLLSGVVQVGPQGLVLNKPAVLSLRHCAILGADWRLSVWASQDQPGDLAVCWKEVLAVGAETINTPAFVQLDSREMFLVSEQLSTVVLVGEPATGTAAKRLLVAVFAETRAGSSGSTRVYVLEDTGAALQSAERTERRLGSRLAATPQTLNFRAGAGALQLELEAGAASPGAPNAMHWRAVETQQIPFSHIWGCSTSQLHCAFPLSGVPADAPFRVRAAQVDDPTRGIVVMATPGRHVSPVSTLSASSNRAVTITASNARLTTCSVESTPLRLPRTLRQQLSHCLDPPNARGNDWRMLAQRLHVDRYITYFGTKPNPTDVILTLWEARSREPSAIADLMATLRLMGRQDAVQIMEKELGPMWV